MELTGIYFTECIQNWIGDTICDDTNDNESLMEMIVVMIKDQINLSIVSNEIRS